MADRDDFEDGDEESGKSLNGKKKLLIIIILLALLGGGAGAAWFMGFIPGSKPTEATEEEADAPKEDDKQETAEGDTKKPDAKKDTKKGGKETTAGAKPVVDGQPVYYELPELLVNLNTGGKQVSFLKMTVTLELGTPKDQTVVETNLPKIMDICNSYLRELRSHEVSGSAGMQRLKEEMQARINKAIEPTQVKSVLFNNIIQQ